MRGFGLAAVQDGTPSNSQKEHEDRAEENVMNSSGRTCFVLRGHRSRRPDGLLQRSSESPAHLREERISASTPLQADRSCWL